MQLFQRTFVLLLFTIILFAAEAQTKRALLIGVGTYPDVRWKPLSVANDIQYLKEALQLQGFQPANMTVLIDSQATFSKLEQAFQTLQQSVKPGDVVYVHFSGHGQQIEDDEANPDEVDGYDEALVPYDARGKYDPVKYKGQNHFRDDNLGKWLDLIRNALGFDGSMMVVIDACHSGTATRSGNFATVRGDPVPFARPEYKPKLKANLSKSYLSEGFMSAAPLVSANMVVFSASSPNQVNYETHDATGKGVGSLSYAVARALQRMNKQTSYADLFSQVKAFIQADFPQQLPMMEGDASQQVFAGNYLAQDKQTKIDRWISDTSFVVNLGQLHGIYAGTVVSLLDASTRKSIGTATIVESTPVSSVGYSKKALDKTMPYIVDVVAYGTPSFTAGVKVIANKGVSKQQTEDITNWLKLQPFVTMSSAPEYMLELTNTAAGTTMELVETGDAVRWAATVAEGQSLGDAEKLLLSQTLKAGTRTRFLRALPDGGPDANLVKVTIDYKGEKDASNEWKLPQSADYTLSIINNSDKRLYFNLLNILSTNESQVLLPAPREQPQDYSIGPGQPFVLDGISVDDDAKPGKEFLRVVLSSRPLDLRPVFEAVPNGAKKRSIGGSFEQWLNDSLEKTSGGAKTRGLGADEVTVVSTGFQVVNKQ